MLFTWRVAWGSTFYTARWGSHIEGGLLGGGGGVPWVQFFSDDGSTLSQFTVQSEPYMIEQNRDLPLEMGGVAPLLSASPVGGSSAC